MVNRVRRAKWLPDREVDLVYLYSDHYLDAREPVSAQTDFFTVTRMDAWGRKYLAPRIRQTANCFSSL